MWGRRKRFGSGFPAAHRAIRRSILGIAGQTIHRRKRRHSKKKENRSQRLKRNNRESLVWGRVLMTLAHRAMTPVTFSYVIAVPTTSKCFAVCCRTMMTGSFERKGRSITLIPESTGRRARPSFPARRLAQPNRGVCRRILMFHGTKAGGFSNPSAMNVVRANQRPMDRVDPVYVAAAETSTGVATSGWL